MSDNEIVIECERCGKHIPKGSAYVCFTKNIEQIEHSIPDNQDEITIIDSEMLIALCGSCGNKFDLFAIGLWCYDTKVGYIPREENEVIARLMDAGKQFFATIASKEIKGQWLKLEIKVMLKE